jgi:hypothetical protein
LGVKHSLIGCKQHIATLFTQFGAVRIEGTRVAGKVFVGQKLQAVDKNAGHAQVAQGFGLAQQGQMAFVQIAHGGHKGRAMGWAQVLAQFFNGSGNEHGG